MLLGKLFINIDYIVTEYIEYKFIFIIDISLLALFYIKDKYLHIIKLIMSLKKIRRENKKSLFIYNYV